MISFVDGPAAGKSLHLRRAPRYLRVGMWQIEEGCEIDALDQLDDFPNPGETMAAYARVREPLRMFVDYSTRNGRRGEMVLEAEYYVVTEQPPQSVMQDNTLWRKWCVDRAGVAGGLFTAPAPPDPVK